MLKRTPLYDWHGRHGARLIDFGGWDMPLHYGSQLAEHHAVRRHAGLFDVSHMCAVDVLGTDARPFLRQVLANSVDKLVTPGKALYSLLLNPEGGIIDDLIVYFFAEDRFRLVVNAATADKDVAWLERCRHDLGLTDLQLKPRREGSAALAMLAVQGPQARALTAQALPALAAASELAPFHALQLDTDLGPCTVATTGYTGEDGYEISLPATAGATLADRLLAAGVQPCGLGARDTLRLEAGMNLYGQDMDESTCPLDAGLGWTLALNAADGSPRQFIGRAALEQRGQQCQFLGLVLDGGGILRAGQSVSTDLGPGHITSGSFSPTLNRSIALARLPLGLAVGAQVRVTMRDKSLSATVVKPPFVRHGTSKIPFIQPTEQ